MISMKFHRYAEVFHRTYMRGAALRVSTLVLFISSRNTLACAYTCTIYVSKFMLCLLMVVLRLMAPPPFHSPPKYIRASLYHYHFTPYDSQGSLWGESGHSILYVNGAVLLRLNQTDAWWKREFNSEYLYALTKDDKKLLEYLEGNNYLSEVSVYGF